MITPADFEPLSTLVKTHELKPGVTYVVICDGKSFSYEHAHHLLARLRDDHPELDIHIIATTAPKGIVFGERKEPAHENPSSQSS